MKYICIFSLVIVFLVPGTFAGDPVFKYWVQFRDKQENPYSQDRPEEFLSRRAIERRQRYNIPIRWNDLPVNPVYLDRLKSEGVRILYPSKWLNGAVIETADSGRIKDLLDLSFVTQLELMYQPPCPFKSTPERSDKLLPEGTTVLFSDQQIEMLHGDVLHKMGYRGDSMVIALLDSGFRGADTLSGFDSLFFRNKVLGTRNFVEPGMDIFLLGEHGTNVLSVMGGNLPGTYLGTAPDASFLLIQTEDERSEFHIEEMNWLAGAELADSAGADIINSSLGYSDGFTCPAKDYAYTDMDGNTALVTRAADLAASKGMLVVSSAGNSGGSEDPWQYISAPGDGDSVLTVGAVDPAGEYVDFSSRGPAFDGRIKPDLVAMGFSTAVLRARGSVELGNGTSFSAPIIAGLAACLWQKHRDLNPYELIGALRKSSDLYPYPDYRMGYGKPDFLLADRLILRNAKAGSENLRIHAFPNPAGRILNLVLPDDYYGRIDYEITDMSGRKLISETAMAEAGSVSISIDQLDRGTYILVQVKETEQHHTIFIKR